MLPSRWYAADITGWYSEFALSKSYAGEPPSLCTTTQLKTEMALGSWSQGSNSNVAANPLVLCPNHRVEFDYGSIAVEPDTLEIRHKHHAGRLSIAGSRFAAGTNSAGTF